MYKSLFGVSCVPEESRRHHLAAPERGVGSVGVGLFYRSLSTTIRLFGVSLWRVSCVTEVCRSHQLPTRERGVEFVCTLSRELEVVCVCVSVCVRVCVRVCARERKREREIHKSLSCSVSVP